MDNELSSRPSGMKIWRVNLRTREVKVEEPPQHWDSLGGRGLTARILLDEVDPTCDPLGPRARLIFAPGLLVGHMLTSCDRLSVGGKSPLTGGIKESNAGGTTALLLTHLGIKALILEDKPEESSWCVLHLSKAGVRFDLAEEYVGQGVYQCAEMLLERYGQKVALALIGTSGEQQLLSAGIQNLDKDHVPSRIAARGGLGAVMGSKGVKAIVVDAEGGAKPAIQDLEAFRAAQKVFTQAVLAHPQTEVYRDYGTAANSMMCNTFGALPTRNFSQGTFEKVEDISGEHMRDLLLGRGGDCETSHACMPGCVIRSSNIYGGPDGKTIVSPLEYETIGLMGSNLGIAELDEIARMNWEANDQGLDTIELGAALGVAAEAGVWKFGDSQRAFELIEEIRQGTPLGRLLGSGATTTGKVLGVNRVPAVKGQSMSAYEPRVIKGTGVTYATSPQGADHTCGLTIRAKVDHSDPTIQAELSRGSQINMAGYDTLGACIFAGFGFSTVPGTISELLNSRYGWQVETDVLQKLGRETLTIEREFNRRAGFTPADDRLPEWMTTEPVAPRNLVFDVSDSDLDSVFNW